MNAPKVVLPFVASVHPVVDVLFKRFSSVWVLSNETLGTVKTWRRWLSILIRFSPQVSNVHLHLLWCYLASFFFFLSLTYFSLISLNAMKAINHYKNLSDSQIHTITKNTNLRIYSHLWHVINHSAGSVCVRGSADVHCTARCLG